MALSPVRLAPSGPLLDFAQVTGWNVIRSIEDLPAPNGSGERILEPGGYMFVPQGPTGSIDLPPDEGIVLAGAGDPFVIIGNNGELRHSGPAPTSLPLMRVDESAIRVSIHDVFFVGEGDQSHLQVSNAGDDQNVYVSGCTFAGAIVGAHVTDGPTPPDKSRVVFDGCIFFNTTRGILSDATQGRIQVSACKFVNIGFGVSLNNVSGSDSMAVIVGSHFEAAAAGIEWDKCSKVRVIGCMFTSLADAVLSVGASKAAMSILMQGCQALSIGDFLDLTAGAPNLPGGGAVIDGCSIDGGGFLSGAGATAAAAEIYVRSVFQNSAKITESTITP